MDEDTRVNERMLKGRCKEKAGGDLCAVYPKPRTQLQKKFDQLKFRMEHLGEMGGNQLQPCQHSDCKLGPIKSMGHARGNVFSIPTSRIDISSRCHVCRNRESWRVSDHSCWKPLLNDALCAYLVTKGTVLGRPQPSATFWVCIAVRGRFLMVSYGSLWFLLVPFGSLWFLMVPYGSFCFGPKRVPPATLITKIVPGPVRPAI